MKQKVIKKSFESSLGPDMSPLHHVEVVGVGGQIEEREELSIPVESELSIKVEKENSHIIPSNDLFSHQEQYKGNEQIRHEQYYSQHQYRIQTQPPPVEIASHPSSFHSGGLESPLLASMHSQRQIAMGLLQQHKQQNQVHSQYCSNYFQGPSNGFGVGTPVATSTRKTLMQNSPAVELYPSSYNHDHFLNGVPKEVKVSGNYVKELSPKESVHKTIPRKQNRPQAGQKKPESVYTPPYDGEISTLHAGDKAIQKAGHLWYSHKGIKQRCLLEASQTVFKGKANLYLLDDNGEPFRSNPISIFSLGAIGDLWVTVAEKSLSLQDKNNSALLECDDYIEAEEWAEYLCASVLANKPILRTKRKILQDLHPPLTDPPSFSSPRRKNVGHNSFTEIVSAENELKYSHTSDQTLDENLVIDSYDDIEMDLTKTILEMEEKIKQNRESFDDKMKEKETEMVRECKLQYKEERKKAKSDIVALRKRLSTQKDVNPTQRKAEDKKIQLWLEQKFIKIEALSNKRLEATERMFGEFRIKEQERLQRINNKLSAKIKILMERQDKNKRMLSRKGPDAVEIKPKTFNMVSAAITEAEIAKDKEKEIQFKKEIVKNDSESTSRTAEISPAEIIMGTSCLEEDEESDDELMEIEEHETLTIVTSNQLSKDSMFNQNSETEIDKKSCISDRVLKLQQKNMKSMSNGGVSFIAGDIEEKSNSFVRDNNDRPASPPIPTHVVGGSMTKKGKRFSSGWGSTRWDDEASSSGRKKSTRNSPGSDSEFQPSESSENTILNGKGMSNKPHNNNDLESADDHSSSNIQIKQIKISPTRSQISPQEKKAMEKKRKREAEKVAVNLGKDLTKLNTGHPRFQLSAANKRDYKRLGSQFLDLQARVLQRSIRMSKVRRQTLFMMSPLIELRRDQKKAAVKIQNNWRGKKSRESFRQVVLIAMKQFELRAMFTLSCYIMLYIAKFKRAKLREGKLITYILRKTTQKHAELKHRRKLEALDVHTHFRVVPPNKEDLRVVPKGLTKILQREAQIKAERKMQMGSFAPVISRMQIVSNSFSRMFKSILQVDNHLDAPEDDHHHHVGRARTRALDMSGGHKHNQGGGELSLNDMKAAHLRTDAIAAFVNMKTKEKGVLINRIESHKEDENELEDYESD